MSTPEKVIHIDIPVKLTEVKVVFSIASLSFEGDLPASLFHMGLIMNDSADWKVKPQVFAIFHTNAGHVTLCGATAKAHNYGNADLLPGIPINTDAMARTTQLVQEGFIKVSES